MERAAPGFLFGLAPDGVFRALPITRQAVSSYLTFSPLPRPCGRGGLFSVALSVEMLSHSARVYLRAEPELRGIAPSGVRTFLPRPLRAGSDSPPFRNQPQCNPVATNPQRRNEEFVWRRNK